TLRDRSKDLIISGGSNIYPREIEEVLLHPGVLEAAVVGRPHREWGEEVVAFVVARPGSEVSPAALDSLCLENIGRYKRPREYRALTGAIRAVRLLRNHALVVADAVAWRDRRILPAMPLDQLAPAGLEPAQVGAVGVENTRRGGVSEGDVAIEIERSVEVPGGVLEDHVREVPVAKQRLDAVAAGRISGPRDPCAPCAVDGGSAGL